MADRDMVNHPSHYETGKFECIDVMLETQGYLATLGFCIGNVFKYSYRHGDKNGKEDEDIEKLGWYRDKYIELLNRREEFINNSEDIVKDLAKFFPDADELINGPKSHVAKILGGEASNDYKSGTSPDIQAMKDDFSKFMNPPVEGYTYDDSCDFKSQVNPDKDGWYDAMHLQLLPGFDPRYCKLTVPEGKVLELMLENGATVIFKHDSILHFGGYMGNDGFVVRDLESDDMSYDVLSARYLDESQFKEETND